MEELYRMLDPKRTLIYIMMENDLWDLGSLCHTMRDDWERSADDRVWTTVTDRIDRMWNDIEQKLEALTIDFETVKIYQEWLPVCDRELRYVKELASAGSRNHEIILRFVDRGAEIVGTESPDLLAESQELLKLQLISARRPDDAGISAGKQMLSRFLLVWRDQFIADRINETLREGETGILFLSKVHSIADRLKEDIRIIYPTRVETR